MKLSPKEKEVAKKITTELVVSARLFESFPAGDRKGGKKWKDGFMMGAKQMVLSAAGLIKDENFTEGIKELLEMELEVQKLFGKHQYKKIKEYQAKVKK